MHFIPKDTNYVPLTQQKRLCTPTCIQMVMLRRGIPLVSAEVIGNMMWLIVPEEGLKYFRHAKTGPKPAAGRGTQAGKPQYGPNTVFKKLGIPLKMTRRLINTFKNKEQFYAYLEEHQNKDIDVLVCFDRGILFNRSDYTGGHLCVLDKVYLNKKELRIIDPEYEAPKRRTVSIDKLFASMQFHGTDNSGGFWELLSFSRK